MRFRPTYANVTATLALVLALGGTAYAGVTLGKGAVKGVNIAPNAITSPKVKDKSLLAKDFAPGQLPAGERGPCRLGEMGAAARLLGPGLVGRLALQDGGQNLLVAALQNERAALRVAAAARRAPLRDREAVFSCRGRVGSRNRLQPEEMLLRLGANDAFDGDRRHWWHRLVGPVLFQHILE